MRVVDQRALNATASLTAAAIDDGRVRPGGVAHASLVQSLTGSSSNGSGGSRSSGSNNNNSGGGGGGGSGTKACSLPNSSQATSFDEPEQPHNTGRWSDDEHERFLDGLAKHGALYELFVR